MPKVHNQKIIKTISKRLLFSNKRRNIIAILAITLTATLFTSLFTIGGGLINTMEEATMRQVGTSSHAGLKYLSQDQYDKFLETSGYKDISYSIIVSVAENEELKKKQNEIRYSEDNFAKWGFSYPTKGTMPKERMDVAVSTLTLDSLGLPHELGQKIPLEFSVNDIKYSEVFNLSGFWEGDPIMQASQVFLSKEYVDSVISIPRGLDFSGWDNMLGTINADIWFSSSVDIEGNIQKLITDAGFDEDKIMYGVNWSYMGSGIDIFFLLAVCLVLLLILLSGYLIIYNIFYISVSQDTRFYGMLKTIGTTGKQLKKIVIRQALYLCIVGIPLGLIIGYFLGYALMPTIMGMTSFSESFSMSVSPLIFIFAAAFSLVTVYISCLKPCRIAGKISPVEAIKYTDTAATKQTRKKVKATRNINAVTMGAGNITRNPKKLLLVILSLSLSMILLNSVYSAVKGFNMEKYLSFELFTDYAVADHTVYNATITDTNYEGVDSIFLQELSKQPGIEASGNIYFKEEYNSLSETAYNNYLNELENILAYYPPRAADAANQVKDNKSSPIHIYGIGELVANFLDINGDPIDYEKLSSGDYVLATNLYRSEDRDIAIYYPGDKVLLDDRNGETKEYEVLALIEYPYNIGCRHSHLVDTSFILSEEAFLDLYGQTNPMMTIFDVEDAYLEDTESWLSNYSESINPDITHRSREFYRGEFENMQNTYLVVGGVLSFILALIGILNFLNAIITSILARQREIAMLQSIGMTGKQLKNMLVSEGVLYAVLMLAFTLTIGTVLSRLLTQMIAGQVWFYEWYFTLTPILLCIPILLLICVIVPLLCYRKMKKQSIVERLREE